MKQEEMARKGGKAVAKKYGKAYMRMIASKGGKSRAKNANEKKMLEVSDRARSKK